MTTADTVLRVLVIDDSAFARQTISGILNGIEGVTVAGKAHDGADAIPKLLRLEPDLVTLDIEMPNMDGYEFLRWLMANRPTPAIVVSSVSGSGDVFRALELGAIDFIRKPQRSASPELQNIQSEIERVVEELPSLRLQARTGQRKLRPRSTPPVPARTPTRTVPRPRPSKPLRGGNKPPQIVVIGASTGGPTAIEMVLKGLPSTFPSPVLIVQHMPSGFTHLFAERLNKMCRIRVEEGRTGAELRPGVAYVCPGGFHTLVESSGTLAAIAADPTDRYVPSVNRTMRSVASVYGNKTLALLLTGMGDDGREGMKAVDEVAGLTVAESEDTALVFGMPERAISAGVVDLVLSVDEIRDLLAGLAARESR